MSTVPGDFPVQGAITPACISERILSAAADLCTLVGMKNVAMSDIARRAELDIDAVYEQWPTLTDLTTAVVIRDLQDRIGEMTTAIGVHHRLDDKIAEGFVSMYWFLDSHPMVGGALRSDADVILPGEGMSVSAVITVASSLLVDSIREVLRDGVGISFDTEPLEEVTTRLIQSLLLAPGVSQPLGTRADVARYAQRCFVPLVHAMCYPDIGDLSID
jgi:AcrR family transcriptional regulator